LIATTGRGLAVADVVKAVFKLLPGDGRAIAPILFAARDLTEGVVLIDPTRTVSKLVGN